MTDPKHFNSLNAPVQSNKLRILVIKPSSLGDIVHAMVVISELKSQHPNWIIDWIIGDRFFNIIDQSKIASRVIIYERHGGLSSIFRLISEIRKEHYDYVFDMQGLARSGLMTFFARSPRKIGRKDAREFSRLAYSQIIKYPGPVHAIDILREFLPIVGCNPEVSGLVKELNDIDSPNFKTFLDTKIYPNKMICLFPESRRQEKEWSFFVPLIQELLKQIQHTAILFLGSKSPINDSIQSPLFFDLCGKTSLTDIIFFIKNAQLVIANDSGPLHIAAALGRNTLGLFTATNPLRFGPYPLHKNTHKTLQLHNAPSEINTVTQAAIEMLAGDQNALGGN